MYQLAHKTETQRTYRNDQTGTEVTTSLKYTDEDGAGWWAFDDLFNIPAIRKIASQKIAQLYGANVTLTDITGYIEKQKATLRGPEPDRHERAYAELLNFETIVSTTADPVRQSLALCSVYVLADEERIDSFSMASAAAKIELWGLKPDVATFFLSWWTDGINPYMKALTGPSPIVSREGMNRRPPLPTILVE